MDETGIFRSVFRALSPLPDRIVIVMAKNSVEPFPYEVIAIGAHADAPIFTANSNS